MIKEVIYMLRRYYGTKVDFYIGESTDDLETGDITTTLTKKSLRVVILPENTHYTKLNTSQLLVGDIQVLLEQGQVDLTKVNYIVPAHSSKKYQLVSYIEAEGKYLLAIFRDTKEVPDQIATVKGRLAIQETL